MDPLKIIIENEKLIYNVTDGLIFRKFKNGNVKLIGTNRGDGYKSVRINGKDYLQHRLIYEKAFGTIDENMIIDHINHNRADNRIENLRLVTIKQNCQNTSKPFTNSSGHKNICWDKSRDKWQVRISTFHFGRFLNLEDAIKKRNETITELNSQGNLYSV